MNKLLLSSILVPALSASALAQTSQVPTESSDEIVVTGEVSNFGATKSDIPILETARSVEIITSDVFTERGALTLSTTLGYTSAVVGDAFGFSTRGDFAYVRGLDVPEYLDNIQVLFGFYNNARSDVYTLEQVEVLKGPASVLYGQGSPGGIINTVSKKAGADALGREIVLEYGSHDRKQISTDLGVDLSGDGALTGRLVALYRNSGTQIDFVNDDALVLAPSVTYAKGGTRLTALLNYTDRKSDTSHQFLPLTVTGCNSDSVTFADPLVCANAPDLEVDRSFYNGDPNFNAYDTQSLSITGFAEQDLTENLRFEATARYRDNSADYRQSWISFLGDGVPRVLPDGTAMARTWYDSQAGSDQIALDARLRYDAVTGPVEHQILAGVNHQDVETYQDSAYIFGRPTTFNFFSPVYDGAEVPASADFEAIRGLTENTTKSTGIYINDQMEWGRFVVNAGVRFDDLQTDDQNDSATSFSLGGLYRSDIGLNPYISYAESFQPVVGADTVTGDPFEPQEGKQVEIGLKYQPSGTRTYITAAYFDIEQSNLPNPNALANAPSQQEGIATVTGFEIEAQTAWQDFYLDAAASFLDTEDANGETFSSLPENQASAWLSWRPKGGQFDNLILGGGVRYNGENESGWITTDSVTLFDAMIGYSFEDVSLTLTARNLADTEYYGTCLTRGDCFPGEGRTLHARAAYNF